MNSKHSDEGASLRRSIAAKISDAAAASKFAFDNVCDRQDIKSRKQDCCDTQRMAKQRQDDRRDTLEQQQNSKKVRLSNAADLQQVEGSSKKAAASTAEQDASRSNESEGTIFINEHEVKAESSNRSFKRLSGNQASTSTSSSTARHSLPRVMRRNVKEFEYQYVSLCL